MLGDEAPDWIETRIKTALDVASVAEGVADAVRDSMRGVLAERRLAAGELSRLAQDLLGKLDEVEE